jgi:Uncharacterised MFS-type transporter YbfB
VRPGLPAIAVAAVAVGGTFMVVTMSGMRAAREAAPGPSRLVAGMTTAFAAGQLVGPLLVRGDDLAAPSVLAAAVLLATAVALLLPIRALPTRALPTRVQGRLPHDAPVDGPTAPDPAGGDGPRAAGGG